MHRVVAAAAATAAEMMIINILGQMMPLEVTQTTMVILRVPLEHEKMGVGTLNAANGEARTRKRMCAHSAALNCHEPTSDNWLKCTTIGVNLRVKFL